MRPYPLYLYSQLYYGQDKTGKANKTKWTPKCARNSKNNPVRAQSPAQLEMPCRVVGSILRVGWPGRISLVRVRPGQVRSRLAFRARDRVRVLLVLLDLLLGLDQRSVDGARRYQMDRGFSLLGYRCNCTVIKQYAMQYPSKDVSIQDSDIINQ